MKSYRPLPRFNDLVPKLRHKDDAKSKVALIVTSYLRLVLREKKFDVKHQSAKTVVKTFGKRRTREKFGSGVRYACM